MPSLPNSVLEDLLNIRFQIYGRQQLGSIGWGMYLLFLAHGLNRPFQISELARSKGLRPRTVRTAVAQLLRGGWMAVQLNGDAISITWLKQSIIDQPPQ